MRRSLFALLTFVFCFWISGCANSADPSGPPVSIEVIITNPFPNGIQAGDANVTLNAVVKNDPSKRGVKWGLSVADTACSPACGTLVASASPSFSAVYTPPAVSPLNQNATITASAVADPRQVYTFNFTIIPLTSVAITNKFTSTIAGGAAITVNAAVSNDSMGGGVTFTLT